MPSEQIAQMSLYKKMKRANNKSESKNCTSCGGEGHRSYNDLPVGQKADCKAHDKFCERCGRANHLAGVCKTPEQFIKKNQSQKEAEDKDKDLGHNVLQLMSMTVGTGKSRLPMCRTLNKNKSSKKTLKLGSYKDKANKNKNSLVQEPSATQNNKVFVDMKLDVSSYKDLGGSDVLSANVGDFKTIEAVADTGATSCCAPWWMAGKLGITLNDTFKSSSSLFAADGRELKIKGFVPVLFSVDDSEGNKILVKDSIYIVKGLEEVFISQKVLMELGSLPQDFPTPVVNRNISEVLNVNKDISTQGTPSEVLDDDVLSKDTVKENRLRRRKAAKLRKKEAEDAKELYEGKKDNSQQLKEASATDSLIFSKHSGDLVNKDKINAVGGEIVEKAAVGEKDDGPVLEEIAPAAQLLPFRSNSPAENV